METVISSSPWQEAPVVANRTTVQIVHDEAAAVRANWRLQGLLGNQSPDCLENMTAWKAEGEKAVD